MHGLPEAFTAPDCRLLVLSGRGGVGKTTTAVASARIIARTTPERRFVLLSIDPAHSVRDCLDISDFSRPGASLANPSEVELPESCETTGISRPEGAPASVPANLEVRELDAHARHHAFRRAHDATLAEIARRGTFLDEEDIQRFLDLPLPGLDELMAVLAISDILADTSIDQLILDTAPGGHTLRMLASPTLLTQWFDALDALLAKHRLLLATFRGSYTPDHTDAFVDELRERCQRVAALLRSSHCRFVVVTTPERTALADTQNMCEALEQLGIDVGFLVVNRRTQATTTCPMCAAAVRAEASALHTATNLLQGRDVVEVLQLKHEPRGEALDLFWEHARPLELRDLPPAVPTCPPAVRGQTLAVPPGCRLLLVAGKGGVGKTTVACATSLGWRTNHRVVLLSTDPTPTFSSHLGVTVGDKPVELTPGTVAQTVDAAAQWQSLRETYLRDVEGSLLRSPAGVDLTFDGDVMEHLLEVSPPGLDEMIAVTQVLPTLLDDPETRVVLDCSATGHLVRLLQLPELLSQWIRTMFEVLLKYRRILRAPSLSDSLIALSRNLKRLRTLLSDPETTRLLLVTLPTEVAYAEACRLLETCQKIPLSVERIIINQVTAPPPGCSHCRAIAGRQAPVLERWAASQTPCIHITQGSAPAGLDMLTSLGQQLWGTKCTATT